MSIWDKYPNYTADDLRTLTAVAAEVLFDNADDAGVNTDVLALSPKSAAAQLQPLLEDPGIKPEQIQAALEDPERSREMALAVLGEIRRIPPLATLVAEAYDARSNEMAGPALLLLAGAIVILAIKAKSFSLTKEGIQASFYEANESVKTFVSGLVKSAGGGA